VARHAVVTRQPRYVFREQPVVVLLAPVRRSFGTHVLQASIVVTTLIASYSWLHHLAYAGSPARIASYFPWG